MKHWLRTSILLLAVLLILAVLYLLLSRQPTHPVPVAARYAAIGVMLGLCVFFKNFTYVILVALAITYVMHILQSGFTLRTFLGYGCRYVLILLAMGITTTAMYAAADQIIGQPTNRAILPCYANVGLHSSGTGQYNSELYREYFDLLRDNDWDYDTVNDIILQQLREDIRDNKALGVLLDFKAAAIVQEDNERLRWVEKSMNAAGHPHAASLVYDQKRLLDLEHINDGFYHLVIWCMGLGLIPMIKRRDIRLFFLYLVIFGSTLMPLIVEAQGRYLYAVQTLYCVTAVAGIRWLRSGVQWVLDRYREQTDRCRQ